MSTEDGAIPKPCRKNHNDTAVQLFISFSSSCSPCDSSRQCRWVAASDMSWYPICAHRGRLQLTIELRRALKELRVMGVTLLELTALA